MLVSDSAHSKWCTLGYANADGIYIQVNPYWRISRLFQVHKNFTSGQISETTQISHWNCFELKLLVTWESSNEVPFGDIAIVPLVFRMFPTKNAMFSWNKKIGVTTWKKWTWHSFDFENRVEGHFEVIIPWPPWNLTTFTRDIFCRNVPVTLEISAGVD